MWGGWRCVDFFGLEKKRNDKYLGVGWGGREVGERTNTHTHTHTQTHAHTRAHAVGVCLWGGGGWVCVRGGCVCVCV